MKRKWKIIIGAVILVFVAAVMIIQGTKPLEADILTVKRGDIAQIFKEEGLVRTDQETLVYTEYGGKVTGLTVREGDTVQAGDLLVAFDSQELQYQIESLQAQMRSIEAQKDLEEMKIDLEALQILYEAGAISKKELKEAKGTIHSDYYPALIAAVEAQIKQLNYQVSLRNVAAPADGIVAELQIKEGMVLSPAACLLTIFSGDNFHIETHVLTEDVAHLRQGTEVSLIQNNKNGDIVFPGTVLRIAPSAVEMLSPLGLEEQRVKVTIAPQIPAGLVLKPGYVLDVEFTVDKQENVLAVPKTVLFPYEGGDALWVVQEGKAQVQPVTKGFENDMSVAITEGLQEGALVILNPKLEGLKEGKKIRQTQRSQ